MYDHNAKADDGSVESPNLTENQFKYAEILSQLAKIAVFISLRPSKFRVEAPDGMNKMITKINADGKSYDMLTFEERKSYEDQFLYETHSGTRLGGAGAILQQLLMEAGNDHEIQEIRKQCLEDIKLNASKATTKYVDSKNSVNLK